MVGRPRGRPRRHDSVRRAASKCAARRSIAQRRARRHPSGLGSAAAAGNLDPHRHDDVLGHAQEVVGLPRARTVSPRRCARSVGSSAHCSRSIGSKNPILRHRIQLGLDKGEARNALARAIYFCRLGEMRDRSFENQFFRASGLSLLVAAIILWNTKYLDVAYADLKRQGRPVARNRLSARCAPSRAVPRGAASPR
jgi:Tn3 transposase DDE domain